MVTLLMNSVTLNGKLKLNKHMTRGNQRTKYIGTGPQSFVKAGWNVCDISNNALIFDTEKDHALAIARAYNHLKCDPVKPLKYIAMNFLQVFDSINNTGGASYNIHTGELNPRDGFMVGLPNVEKKVPVPATLNDFQNVVVQYVLEFRDAWKQPHKPVFLGFWIHNDELVIDFSERVDTIGEAYVMAIDRNQVAIYSNKDKVALKVLNAVSY